MNEPAPESPSAEDEVRGCGAVVVQGRFYLSNGDPGYPDEYCDNEALPDSDYCEDHQGADEDLGPEDIDPDYLHDAWNEAEDVPGE